MVLHIKVNADKENIVGNWWNHKILTSNSQISPLSGSIKKQEVNFISKEILKLMEMILQLIILN